MIQSLFTAAILIAVVSLSGCATRVPDDPIYATIDTQHLPAPNLSVHIPGLGPCTSNDDRAIAVNTQAPVTVLVHGCYGSAARFRALAQVFAFHGQQALCFSYDDRDSMIRSSDELVEALDALMAVMRAKELTVIAHSQGGLIARKALVRDRPSSRVFGAGNARLITVSAPFSGIASASRCVSRANLLLSLGLALPVCRLISGAKWFEITEYSEFINTPGLLIDQVSEHLKIVTDERGSCRKFGKGGDCIEDDFVFSREEQYKDTVDNGVLVENIEVKAGHAEIVGDHEIPPRKLIDILQRYGIMLPTMLSRRTQFERFLAELY